MINSDTPSDILNYSIDDVVNLVESNIPNMPSARVRLNYTKMLYDVLGFDLTADVALASISEPQAELVLSTAGGGKTTWSQIKGVAQKIIRRSKTDGTKHIRGAQVLCLVYNEHNVKAMKLKHAQIVHRLMSANIKGLDIDDTINACTMHSFCNFFRKQFIAKLGLVGYTLAKEEDSIKMMQRAVHVIFKKFQLGEPVDVSAQKLHEFYTLSIETMKDISELQETDLFVDLKMDLETIGQIFTQFEAIKNRSQKYEFIDMIYKVYQLLLRDEDALKFVQSYYEYIIADEVQDFTPLMWEMLKLFVSDGTPLTCIGDEDQNLYLFRGADIEDTLHFKDRFPNSKVYLLSENRRCQKEILTEAKRVISENKLRFNKDIIGFKSGGVIETIPYSTAESQVIKLTKMISAMSVEEQSKTVICYRNIECSQLVSEMLAEADIGINCLKAFQPYTHELYKHLIQVLNALEMPCDREAYKNLWKVLPCKRNEFLETIGYNTQLGRFVKSDDHQHFATLNYGRLMNYNGFADAVKVLVEISDKIDTAQLTEIFPTIMRYLSMYFWNFKKHVNGDTELDLIFEKRVETIFNVPQSYRSVLQNIQYVQSRCASDTKIGAGVTLSTFHSLKGLEFDTVFAVYLDNDIFPNFPLIEYHQYSKRIEQGLKEAETRLWYVVVTRAIHRLVLMYNDSNPSKYVIDYLNRDKFADEQAANQQFDCEHSINTDFDDEFDSLIAFDEMIMDEPLKDATERNTEVLKQKAEDNDIAATNNVHIDMPNISAVSVGGSKYIADLLASL